MKNKETGKKGEKVAARYLVSQGYRILEENWRFRFGEIDLIVAKDGTVVFVEVKTIRPGVGRESRWRNPEDSMTRIKRMTLRRAASLYINEVFSQDGDNIEYRIDVIAVLLEESRVTVRHYKNALAV